MSDDAQDTFEWPDVTIVLCTYQRYDLIKKVVSKLIYYLDYPQEKINLLVADDSTGDDYLERLSKLKDFNHWNTGFVETDRNCGWGCNVNNALRQVWTDYIFFLEDDYVLTQPLDLKVGIALLESAPYLGMVRYRGTAGGHFIMHHVEQDVSAILPDHVQGVGSVSGKLTHCLLDVNSPNLYVYSHGPHLKRTSFHYEDFYGLYPEGKKLGETEEMFAKHVKAVQREAPNKAQAITILPEWIAMAWDHIGESYQHTKWDD